MAEDENWVRPDPSKIWIPPYTSPPELRCFPYYTENTIQNIKKTWKLGQYLDDSEYWTAICGRYGYKGVLMCKQSFEHSVEVPYATIGFPHGEWSFHHAYVELKSWLCTVEGLIQGSYEKTSFFPYQELIFVRAVTVALNLLIAGAPLSKIVDGDIINDYQISSEYISDQREEVAKVIINYYFWQVRGLVKWGVLWEPERVVKQIDTTALIGFRYQGEWKGKDPKGIVDRKDPCRPIRLAIHHDRMPDLHMAENLNHLMGGLQTFFLAISQ